VAAIHAKYGAPAASVGAGPVFALRPIAGTTDGDEVADGDVAPEDDQAPEDDAAAA
jgi:hypothetical protein